MSEHPHAAPPKGGQGYESSDADVRKIIHYGIAMFAIIFLALGLMWALHLAFEKMPNSLEKEPTAMEMERMVPPKPLLQINQSIDLRDLRKHEDETLSSYGWVRKEAGAVRIPIDRAMELLVERGLPATPAPKPAAKPK